MKFLLRYGFAIMVVLFASGCTQNKDHVPPLNESYRRTDKLPFGSFIAYKGFQSEFPDYWINVAQRPFTKTWQDLRNESTNGYSLYFLITKNLILSVDEVNAMVEYIKAGNDLFISADYVDEKLLDAIYCTINRKGEIVSEVNGKMHDTYVSMFFGKDFTPEKYSYYYFPFLNYFNSYDPSITKVLGVNELNLPNYVVIFSGKGRLYLHLAPRIFSNYFLLTKNNYQYFENVTAYLRFSPQYVYWDEYYKEYSSTRNKNNLNSKDNFSSMQVINQNPPLLWAFYLALAGLLIFVLVNIKRKQREIEVIKPNRNSTVAFTETVGRLYLQHKNNKNIADKQITYFFEYLRRKYFIKTTSVTPVFINSISGKSGVSKEETQELFDLISHIQKEEEVTDDELLSLNLKIENFKKPKSDGRKFI
ncbi:MAG: hypothetical protein ACTHNG_09780 [Ginsengibacter sp.]